MAHVDDLRRMRHQAPKKLVAATISKPGGQR
jgi:hypothetical protein